MSRRIPFVVFFGMLLLITAACTNRKSVNPLSNVGSKQPDKVLFDKAMDAMKHNRFDVARITLQTLINTYPDSEFIARAKLAVGDSWYAEGGTAFAGTGGAGIPRFHYVFPNMPEAAEAQLKIANIQYQQMEKADRDYTHAKRAEDEYRNLILQFPDSKLVPEAKTAPPGSAGMLGRARIYNRGAFYYLRPSYPRQSRACDRWSSATRCTATPMKHSIFLGQTYEGEMTQSDRAPPAQSPTSRQAVSMKVRRHECWTPSAKNAADAYSQIIKRLPHYGSCRRCEETSRRIAPADTQANPKPRSPRTRQKMPAGATRARSDG